MTIKVHGVPLSPITLRVLAALHEKGLEYEFITVDTKSGAHKREPFISLNPFGQVPAFEDGDLKLFESRAITKYLAHAYESKGTPLVYSDPKAMASLAVWMEVEAHQFDPVATKLTMELVYKEMIGMEMDRKAVEENEATLINVLDVYEVRLSKSKYLGGETFSLADLHQLPFVHYLMETEMKKLFEERPHVSAWCKDILARPSWDKALPLQRQF